MALLYQNGPIQQYVKNQASAEFFQTKLDPLIGPTNRTFEFDANASLYNEFTTVADNYSGRVAFLGVFIKGLMAATENEWVFGLLPLRQYNDIHFKFVSYEYPRYMALRTATQGPPNFGTSRRFETTAEMDRYEFGVEYLIESMMNDDGRMDTYGRSLQAVQAFVRTMEANALTAIVNTPGLYRRMWLESRQYHVSITTRFYTEHTLFNALRKYPRAAHRVLDVAKLEMAIGTSSTINAMIVHQGWRSQVASDGSLTIYKNRGPGNQQFADLGGDAPGLLGTLVGTDVRLYVAAPVNADGQGVYQDLLRRDVDLGGMVILDNFGANKPYFRKHFTDAGAFSATADGFVLVRMKTALEFTERYDDSEMGMLKATHQNLCDDAVTLLSQYGLPLHDNWIDMYAGARTDDNGVVHWDAVQFFGQMDKRALTPTVLNNIANYTVVNYLNGIDPLTAPVKPEQFAAFAAGLALAEQLGKLDIDADDIAFAKLSQPEPAAAGGPTRTPGPGGPHVPTDAEIRAAVAAGTISARVNYRPRFFGSPVAVYSLGRVEPSTVTYIEPSVLATARAFVPAAEAMRNAYVALFGLEHPALDPGYVPFAFRSTVDGEQGIEWRSLVNFLHNIFAGNPLPILLPLNNAAGFVVPDYVNDNELTDIVSLTPFLSKMSPKVKQNFATVAAAKAFAARFDNGPVGRAYLTYLATPRAGVQVVQLADNQLSPFVQFYKNEIESRQEKDAGGDVDIGSAKNRYIADRILSAIVVMVERQAARFEKRQLDGLASGYDAFAEADAENEDGDGYYVTRLSAAPDRVLAFTRETLDDGSANPDANSVRLLAPQNNGKAFGRAAAARAEDLAATGKNDSTLMTISSGAHMYVPSAAAKNSGGGNGGAPFTSYGDIAQEVISDGKGGYAIGVNQNFADNYATLKDVPNVHVRGAKLMWMTAQICKRTKVRAYDFHIPPPQSIMIGKCRRRYSTGATVMLSLSDKLGVTAFAMPDVRAGTDAARKSRFLNWSLWTTSIIADPTRIMTIPDTCVLDYVSGEEVTPIKAESFNATQIDPNDEGTAFYFELPAGCLHGDEQSVGVTIDVRGHFSRETLTYNASDSGSALLSPKWHYPSAAYYAMVFGLHQIQTNEMGDHFRLTSMVSGTNTVISQELQEVYVDDGGTMTAIDGADHFGRSTFAGCMQYRKAGGLFAVEDGGAHAHTKWLPHGVSMLAGAKG